MELQQREMRQSTARPSRLEAAKRRARAAKTGLAALAVALFAVVGLAARAVHPGASASPSNTGATELSPPTDLVNALQESDDGFGGGTIAPAQAPPAASTSTS